MTTFTDFLSERGFQTTLPFPKKFPSTTLPIDYASWGNRISIKLKNFIIVSVHGMIFISLKISEHGFGLVKGHLSRGRPLECSCGTVLV